MLGAIITIAFVGIGIYFLFKNIELKKVEDEYQDYIPQEEISDENSQQTKIILYFKNENDELENEIRVINANILLKEPEKQAYMEAMELAKLQKRFPQKLSKSKFPNMLRLRFLWNRQIKLVCILELLRL